MIPNDFVRGCKNHYITVRLKNGDFYTGILDQCDNIMNFVLTNASLLKYGTNEDVKIDRAMIRGGSIQFISLSPNVTEMVKTKRADANYPTNNRGGGNQRQKRQNYYNDNNNNNNNGNNYNRGRNYGRGGYQSNRGRGGNNRNNYNNNYNNSNNNNTPSNFVYTPP